VDEQSGGHDCEHDEIRKLLRAGAGHA
jgi:hypothetical protein